MNEQEALKRIGELIRQARVGLDESQLSFKTRAGIDVKTLRSMESGERWAVDRNRRKVEDALGWRQGAMEDIWRHHDELTPESVTLEEMTRGAGEATWEDLDKRASLTPVMRASQLSDEELLAELSYRFRNYKVLLNGES